MYIGMTPALKYIVMWIGSQIMHMLKVMIEGLVMGATVMIGQAVGAVKQELASHLTICFIGIPFITQKRSRKKLA